MLILALVVVPPTGLKYKHADKATVHLPARYSVAIPHPRTKHSKKKRINRELSSRRKPPP